MALTVTHATTVAVPDDGTSPIGSDEWNAPHVVTGNIGLTDIPSGAAGTVLWSAGAAPAAWSATPTIATAVSVGSTTAPVHTLDITAAGTATVAPVRLKSGTSLTIPVAGAIEYDGNVFYKTPSASNRGVSPSEHFLSLSANQAGTNVNTAQPWFPGGGATGITLPANMTYFFEGKLLLSRSAGTTSHTIATLFGGGATITSIDYMVFVTDQAATTSSLSSGQAIDVAVATATVLTAASANASQFNMIYIRGVVRINGTGTFIPQFIYSAAPGGAPTVLANSYFRMSALGSGSVLNVGNWS